MSLQVAKNGNLHYIVDPRITAAHNSYLIKGSLAWCMRQIAVNENFIESHGVIELMDGVYNFTGAIDTGPGSSIPSGLTIKGDGPGTILRRAPHGTIFGSDLSIAVMRDFTIRGGTGGADEFLIFVGGTGHLPSLVSNIHCDEAGWGSVIGGGPQTTVEHCYIDAPCNYAIYGGRNCVNNKVRGFRSLGIGGFLIASDNTVLINDFDAIGMSNIYGSMLYNNRITKTAAGPNPLMDSVWGHSIIHKNILVGNGTLATDCRAIHFDPVQVGGQSGHHRLHFAHNWVNNVYGLFYVGASSFQSNFIHNILGADIGVGEVDLGTQTYITS